MSRALYERLGKQASPEKLRDAANYLDERRAVSMRVAGSTWDEIASVLGITRQTAYARYGSLVRYERRAADRTPE